MRITKRPQATEVARRSTSYWPAYKAGVCGTRFRRDRPTSLSVILVTSEFFPPGPNRPAVPG